MRKLLFILVIGLLTTQCIPREPIEDGTYVGTFSVRYPNSTQSGAVSLRLENGSYFSTANPNDVPAGGAGTFSVRDKSILFTDTGFHSADFDWGLILNETYNYTFNGRRLTLEKRSGGATYRYEVEKK